MTNTDVPPDSGTISASESNPTWIFFVAHGILAENTCDDQRKLIKCNDLVSDRLIFYNLFALTKAMYKLKRERVHLSAEALFPLRPYLTSHVNRLGVYYLVLDRLPPAIDYKLPILYLLSVADFRRIVVWTLIAEHIGFVTHHAETLRINKQFCGLED